VPPPTPLHGYGALSYLANPPPIHLSVYTDAPMSPLNLEPRLPPYFPTTPYISAYFYQNRAKISLHRKVIALSAHPLVFPCAVPFRAHCDATCCACARLSRAVAVWKFFFFLSLVFIGPLSFLRTTLSLSRGRGSLPPTFAFRLAP